MLYGKSVNDLSISGGGGSFFNLPLPFFQVHKTFTTRYHYPTVTINTSSRRCDFKALGVVLAALPHADPLTESFTFSTVGQVILANKKGANCKKTPKIRQYYLVAKFLVQL